jgi:hypothetical protein
MSFVPYFSPEQLNPRKKMKMKILIKVKLKKKSLKQRQ